ncbi:COX15/CtaA family protein [Chelatococcus reniformis]|uniref:Heme A synthase n=1 Tax=Chelatococcus reniformis TaxID=1494448 RepID=A0A916U079_9HYPH|nr:COX15/CtaA family protein [Chelatococcus reniformis]GGC55074.1 heme A synthase [Chelatococcus reniformis]
MTISALSQPPAAPAAAAPAADRMAAVRAWLAVVALLVVAMVILGGATRLTGSGLSITEWKPVTGAIPPLSDAAWAEEYAKYRATPQYKLLNAGMALSEFKFIFLWEWTHRLLGRLIGLVYILPLVVFAVRGTVRGRLLWILAGIGMLGGLQGAIGWIMVHSGLQPGMTAVAPVKLMLHLLAACLVLAAVLAVWVGLRPRAEPAAPTRLRVTAWLLVGLSFIQIGLGALVAGLHAGLIYNTWPLMDGQLVPGPQVLWPLTPWWLNLFGTVATVQFDHRVGAYALLALALSHAVDAARHAGGRPAARRAAMLAVIVGLQAVLGILTLLLQVPLWAGLLHQLGAVAVLAVAVIHARRIGLAAAPLRASAALAR